MDRLEMYRRMLLIRKTEERIEELFAKGLLRGTTHGSRGQEAIAVGLLSHLDCANDYVTGSHRSHGHFLALNPDPYPFFAELMGKETGMVYGRGGSQHLSYHKFITNGITGGMVPIASGLAFSLKAKTMDRICVSIFGDGAMNEGYVMEALNLSAVFDLPILFVLENNNYAMSTSFQNTNKGVIQKRIEGFGLPYLQCKATDVDDLYDKCAEVVSKIRNTRHPQFIEFITHRFSGHSKSDARLYMPKEIDEYWKKNDPLHRIESKLEATDIVATKISVENMIDAAITRASEDPYPGKGR